MPPAKEDSCPLAVSLHSLLPRSLATTDPLSVPMNLPVFTFYINGTTLCGLSWLAFSLRTMFPGFILAVPCVSTSFLFMAESCGYGAFCVSIHRWYLGCFHFGAGRDNVAVTTVGSEFLCGCGFSVLSGTYVGVELLGHVIRRTLSSRI